MDGSSPRLVPGERAVFARLADGDGVIVDTKTAFYFGLNRTAAFLWQFVQEAGGGVTSEQLVDALCQKYAVEPAQARQDVAQFLERLQEHGLVHRLNNSQENGHSSTGENR
jgi:hypothetical protein